MVNTSGKKKKFFVSLGLIRFVRMKGEEEVFSLIMDEHGSSRTDQMLPKS